jgi:hypothetical protein
MMQTDIHLRYEQALDQSHHGYPTILETACTGNRGRPRISIDPAFLEWAYAHCSTSGICRFLHVGRSVVQNALLEYGIAQPQENPFATSSDDHAVSILSEDDLLDPSLPLANGPTVNVDNTNASSSSTLALASFTGPLSTLSDDALDNLIIQLRTHF